MQPIEVDEKELRRELRRMFAAPEVKVHVLDSPKVGRDWQFAEDFDPGLHGAILHARLIEAQPFPLGNPLVAWLHDNAPRAARDRLERLITVQPASPVGANAFASHGDASRGDRRFAPLTVDTQLSLQAGLAFVGRECADSLDGWERQFIADVSTIDEARWSRRQRQWAQRLCGKYVAGGFYR